MLLPTSNYQPGHSGTGGLHWSLTIEGTAMTPPPMAPDYRVLAQELAIPLLAFLRVLTCPECVKRGTFECRISCDEHPFLSPCEMALASLADAKDAGFEAQL